MAGKNKQPPKLISTSFGDDGDVDDGGERGGSSGGDVNNDCQVLIPTVFTNLNHQNRMRR